MKDRVRKILSQVRTNLGIVNTNELKDKQIYNKANIIQDEIFLETKCKEIEFTIYTKAGEEEYDINLENYSSIKSHDTSWGDKLTYKLITVWNEFSTTGGMYPNYFSLFDKKVLFKPNPLNDDDWIKFYAYQESVIIPMDDDIEPEIPSYADRCLVLGICAEYQPEKFFDRYVYARDKVAINAHHKIGQPKEPEVNW